MIIRKVYQDASKMLVEKGKNDRAALALLMKVLDLESYQLYESLDNEITDDKVVEFYSLLDEYLNDKPLQYILGYETFFGRDFIVNENVLIPRYETEELVENILYKIDDYFENEANISIVDIGCGSGAISISLDLEESKANVSASDISVDALKVAQENNERLNANVTFYHGDLLQPFIDNKMKFDILVSNPPYIPVEETIDNSVKENEPHVALFGGSDGLYFYRKILKDAKLILNDKALLAFEIGYDQAQSLAQEVEKYFENTPYEIVKDLNGKDRMLFIYYNLK